METRGRPHKLMISGDGQFGTTHVYRCDHCPIEAALKDGFFRSLRGNVLPGDEIKVIEIQNDRVTATWECIVIDRTPLDVQIAPTRGPIQRFDNKPLARPMPEVEIVPLEYIKGSGTVKWNPGKKKHEVLVDGQVVGAFKDKGEAQSYARGDAPLTPTAA